MEKEIVMAEETLEEAAENAKKRYINETAKAIAHTEFINGAKWQAERMYYEEEVVDLIADWTKMAKGLNMNFPADKFEQWFKQFERE